MNNEQKSIIKNNMYTILLNFILLISKVNRVELKKFELVYFGREGICYFINTQIW